VPQLVEEAEVIPDISLDGLPDGGGESES
jgi:hypothetical protein